MKKKVLFMLTIMAVMLLCACGSETDTVTEIPSPSPGAVSKRQDAAEPAPGGITIDNYPRVNGSTAAIPLGEALAQEMLGLEREDCAGYADFSGTTDAYTALMEDRADLLLVYEPAPETWEEKAQNGFEWEMVPIGRDALVFLVNRENPVDSLSPRQLRDIYAGLIPNWSDLGGEDIPITAFQRNRTSGSQTLMEKLVMEGMQMAEPPAAYTIATMEGLIRAIANYNNTRQAIGYSVYYYAHNMNPDDGLRFLAVGGVEPTNDTIRGGTYPFVNDFYAVIRADEPAGSPVRVLFDFLTGDAGQAMAERAGYVSVGPAAGAEDTSFALGEIGGRRSEDACYELQAADDYGFLYPFAVPLAAEEMGEATASQNLFGLVDAQGCVVVDPVYSSVELLTAYDEKSGTSRPTDIYLLKLAAEEGWEIQPHNNYVLASCDGRWVSADRYYNVRAYDEAMIANRLIATGTGMDEWKTQCGLLDYEGKTLVPCIYDYMSEPVSDWVLVRQGEEPAYYISLQGETVLTSNEYPLDFNFSDGLVQVYVNGLGGYIGRDGKSVIDPQFEFAGDFNDGYALVKRIYEDNLHEIIDKTGNTVITFSDELVDYRQGVYLCRQSRDSKFKYFRVSNGMADEIERKDIPYVDSISEEKELVVFGKGHEIRIDLDFPERAHIVALPSDNVLIYYYGEDYRFYQSGLIRMDGTWEVPLHDGIASLYSTMRGMYYDNQVCLYIIDNGENGKKGVWDLDGHTILPAEYDQICAAGDMFSVIQGRYSGIINQNGEWLFRKSLLDYLPD